MRSFKSSLEVQNLQIGCLAQLIKRFLLSEAGRPMMLGGGGKQFRDDESPQIGQLGAAISTVRDSAWRLGVSF